MTCSTRRGLSLFLMLLGLVGGPARGDFAYHVTPVGTLNGGSLSRAYAINDQGQVAGEADTSGGNLHGFYWAGVGHPLVDIGTLDGGNTSQAAGINDAGQVAGQSRIQIGQASYTHAYRTEPGGQNPIDLGVLDPAHQYSVANAIADDGSVAGTSINANGLTRAVLWSSGGQITDLGALYEQGQSQGLGLNSGNVVVGQSDVQIGDLVVSHAARFSLDRTTGAVTREDLGALVANGSSTATAISDDGQVTGYSASLSGFTHAFLYEGGLMVDLQRGDLDGSSYGLAIGDGGHVVGELKLTGLGSRAFVWTPTTGMLNLNDLIDPSLGWTLSAATGINDDGQIVGYGTLNGRVRGFRLDPVSPIVPEPSSLVLLALGGLAALAGSSRRWRA